jgi:hypothetical protein
MTRKKTVNRAHKMKENREILLSALCMKVYSTFFSLVEPVDIRALNDAGSYFTSRSTNSTISPI